MENSVYAPPSRRVALVTGANGMGGQALVDFLIRTPKHEWYATYSVGKQNDRG